MGRVLEPNADTRRLDLTSPKCGPCPSDSSFRLGAVECWLSHRSGKLSIWVRFSGVCRTLTMFDHGHKLSLFVLPATKCAVSNVLINDSSISPV